MCVSAANPASGASGQFKEGRPKVFTGSLVVWGVLGREAGVVGRQLVVALAYYRRPKGGVELVGGCLLISAAFLAIYC